MLGLVLIFADCASTYYALEMAPKSMEEANWLARAALEAGGWPMLVAKDLVCFGMVGGLLAVYWRVRRGFTSTERMAAYGMLMVFALVRVGAVMNNMLAPSF
jgi:hypothetical protein